jgi:hypothetical protein
LRLNFTLRLTSSLIRVASLSSVAGPGAEAMAGWIPPRLETKTTVDWRK